MRVLLAEDQNLVGLILAQELQRLGVDVFGPYDTVEEVLRVARKHRIDAAILDVHLRDGDVYPAADTLFEKKAQVIFHTAMDSEHALKQLYPRASVLTKPVPTARLMQALSDAYLSMTN